MNTHPRLAHAPCPPRQFGHLRVETEADHDGPWQPNWPQGTERRVLGRDPTTGGSTSLLTFPAGYDRVDEASLADRGESPRFEYHSCHEEIVSVHGDYEFGVPTLYRFDAPSYLNHPPWWLHPARQRSLGGVLLLVRNSHPVDFGFCDIPAGWSGTEEYLDDAPGPVSPCEAVTVAALDEQRLTPIAEIGDPMDGVRGALLWDDRVSGWQTWLLEAPAGASLAAADARVSDGGDEWFVLDGEVVFEGVGGPTVLGPLGYRCDPEQYPAGGDRAVARTSVRVLRWVRNGALSLDV